MAEVVRMPKMSDTMTEGVIAKWHKKVGDTVKSGDLVAEVETDKATMDFESFQEGTLLYVGIAEGQAAPVDSVIAVIGAPGEDYQALLTASPAPAAEKAAPVVAEAAPLAAAPAASVTPESALGLAAKAALRDGKSVLARPQTAATSRLTATLKETAGRGSSHATFHAEPQHL